MIRLSIICFFATLALSFDNPITNHAWQLLSIDDQSQSRNLQIGNQKVTFNFFGNQLQVICCDTLKSDCNFVRDNTLQAKFEISDKRSCSIAQRQINWYLRYRFSSLVYVVSGDTLQMRDRSGVNYVFLKSN